MSTFFENRRIVVTGGAGFLGAYVTEGLRKRGCKNILVPMIEDYDLVDISDIVRMYEDMKPDIVIHLAAVVGGIGAFFSLGAILGPVLSTWIYAMFRYETFEVLWLGNLAVRGAGIPFLVSSAIGLFSLFLLLAFVEEPKRA